MTVAFLLRVFGKNEQEERRMILGHSHVLGGERDGRGSDHSGRRIGTALEG